MEQAEQALTQARADRRFRALLEAAPDAIIEADRDGRILTLNAVTEQCSASRAKNCSANPSKRWCPITPRAALRASRRL